MMNVHARSGARHGASHLSICLLLAFFASLLAGCGQPTMPKSVGDPGAVTAEGQLGTPLLLANGQSTVYARIRIATLARPERPRGPVNVALALDTSGSMEGAPIEEARKAALQMIDSMRDGDRLAVIAFHTRTEVLLPSTELTQEIRGDLKQRISAMKAEGTTDMAHGLDAAIMEVRGHFVEKGVNRVVLLGDGIPNNATGIEEAAKSSAESGIAITTMGLGLDYDETLMGKIAQLSGGRFKYVESADKVAGFFDDELKRIDAVYARHAAATITAGPGVHIDAVVGAEDGGAGTTAFVTLGDIARGDTRDIVVRMTVTPRKAGVPIELLDTSITFDDALEDAGKLERHVYLGAHTTEAEAEFAKARNPDVELSAALAEASSTTIQALALAKKGYYVRARDLLTKGSAAAVQQSKRTPSPELEKHAMSMESVAKDMPTVDTPVAAAAPTPSPSPAADKGYGYSFSDEAVNAEMVVQPASPAAVRRAKEAHQYAIDALQ